MGIIIGQRTCSPSGASQTPQPVSPAPPSRTTCPAGTEPWHGYIWNTILGPLAKYGHDPRPSPPPSSTSAGFISPLFPPIQRPISSEFSLAPIVATRSQRRAVESYWDLLCRLLTELGHPASLDRIAYDPDEGWRIHFSAADPELVVAMHEVAGEENGPGDLSAFDAHDQVRDWLTRIENRIVCPLSEG